jgi:hypothetical protein
VFAVGERGYSPEFAPGAWIAVGVERGSIGAELRGGGHVTTTAQSPDGGLALWQLAAELRACLRGDARLAPSLCLGMRATRLQARGLGVVQAYERSVLAVAGVGGVGIDSALTERFRVVVAADMLVLVTRPRFVLDDRRRIYQPPLVGFAPWLGMAYRW